MIEFITIGLFGLIVLLSVLLISEVHKQRQQRRSPTPTPFLSTAQWFAIGALLVSYLLYSFTASLSVSAAILLISLYLVQLKPQQQPNYDQPRCQPSFQSRTKTLPPHHPLRIKLLTMVGGDVGTANRLLQQCQKNHPGMETEWYFDKVIYDLIRDRR
ncbi:hypothetical protein HJG54_35310 (plasmid) [Leptolyngbya sp. NK1-12]|uniref:Uncharacterized protein n=1 Tax=Leptolyngbya sp. NK1-12 TaxID=2547451 RepID=A0AA97AKS9_9CYAN|nr:hypothetical protein [Leptolyngbya sp. NK1-12]WNZ28184.1 hypothetical protein HJG54_35310 [Leptolyngbya sp. NK1-12]